jgi:hypothetical protein
MSITTTRESAKVIIVKNYAAGLMTSLLNRASQMPPDFTRTVDYANNHERVDFDAIDNEKGVNAPKAIAGRDVRSGVPNARILGQHLHR